MSFLTTLRLRTPLVGAFCFVFVSLIQVELIQAALINPPAPGQSLPDFFAGCAGCTLLAALPAQTVLSSNHNWQAILTTAVFMDPSAMAVRAAAGLDFFYQLQIVSPCLPTRRRGWHAGFICWTTKMPNSCIAPWPRSLCGSHQT
jgi:hypothetical protein